MSKIGNSNSNSIIIDNDQLSFEFAQAKEKWQENSKKSKTTS